MKLITNFLLIFCKTKVQLYIGYEDHPPYGPYYTIYYFKILFGKRYDDTKRKIISPLPKTLFIDVIN